MTLTVLLIILFIVSIIYIIDLHRRQKGDSGVVEYVLTDVLDVIRPIYPHQSDQKLTILRNAFNSQHFDVAEKLLFDFSEDYRTSGFQMLSEQGDKKVMELWFTQTHRDIPRILMGMRLINEAWEVRGDGYADTVSMEQGRDFYSLLQKAVQILTHSSNHTTPVPEFEIYRLIALIMAYKGIGDYKGVKATFAQGYALAPQNIELHTAYFDAISPKWGGEEEDVQHYLHNIMPKDNPLLSSINLAVYYRDLYHVEEVRDPQTIQKIREFVTEVDTFIEQKKAQGQLENLYYTDLYIAMVTIVRVKSPALVEKYEQLIQDSYG